MGDRIMSYIGYDKATKSFYVIKRPTNQSTPEVLKKIAKRLERLIAENPNIELTELQKLFIRKIKKHAAIQLSKNNIDIAHNIAISVIMDAIVDRMNNPLDEEDIDANEFVDEILSTDDEDGKIRIKKFFSDLQNPNISRNEKLRQANEAIEHLNRASKNLISGYSGPNRSLQSNRDLHLIVENNEYRETPWAEEISKKADVFLKKVYLPKSRKTSDGETEYQSSSVSKIIKKSWTPGLFNYTAVEKFNHGMNLLHFVLEQEEAGKNPLDIKEFEELCETIEELREMEPVAFYNKLAERAASLQRRVVEEEDERLGMRR